MCSSFFLVSMHTNQPSQPSRVLHYMYMYIMPGWGMYIHVHALVFKFAVWVVVVSATVTTGTCATCMSPFCLCIHIRVYKVII